MADYANYADHADYVAIGDPAYPAEPSHHPGVRPHDGGLGLGRAFSLRDRRRLGAIRAAPLCQDLFRRVQPAPCLACPALATNFACGTAARLASPDIADGTPFRGRPGVPLAVSPAGLVKPFSEGALRVMEVLRGLEGDLARLGAYCRVVLPRTIVGYRSWLQRCSGSSDRPVARALGFALADTTNDWERGTAVMLRYLDGPRGPEGVLSVAGASSEVERLLVGQGLVPGG